MREQSFILVKVEFEQPSDNGNVKKIKSEYLVDAMTPTEAEARVREFLKGTTMDYQVVETKKSKIEAVIEASVNVR